MKIKLTINVHTIIGKTDSVKKSADHFTYLNGEIQVWLWRMCASRGQGTLLQWRATPGDDTRACAYVRTHTRAAPPRRAAQIDWWFMDGGAEGATIRE